jgi:hypothetical protein
MGRRVRGPASGWTGWLEPASGWAGPAVHGRLEGDLVPAVCEGEPMQGRAVRCMGRWRSTGGLDHISKLTLVVLGSIEAQYYPIHSFVLRQY